MPINQLKYENLILYLAQKLGGEIRGKKKLAKLLYFVDFDFFEKNETSITNDVYKRLPMGPVPQSLTNVIGNLVQSNSLSTESVQEWVGYEPTEVYKATKSPDLSVFSADEVSMIDRVVEKYGKLSGRQLEYLSHQEAPYVGTGENEEIPYELAFYRGTEL